MSGATFYILVSDEEDFRELSLLVTKKYHYERSVNYGCFRVDKANEYNVLIDYIKSNEENLKERWGLSDEEFIELKEGLEKVLIERYSTGNLLNKWGLLCAFFLRILVKKFSRRIRS